MAIPPRPEWEQRHLQQRTGMLTTGDRYPVEVYAGGKTLDGTVEIVSNDEVKVWVFFPDGMEQGQDMEIEIDGLRHLYQVNQK